MLKTVLMATQEFTSFGTTFRKGDVVPQEVALAWPEGTLARRIDGQFLRYSSIEVPEPESESDNEVSEEKVQEYRVVLSEMTKAEIVEQVKEDFGVELAPETKKDDLIEQAVELLKNHSPS